MSPAQAVRFREPSQLRGVEPAVFGNGETLRALRGSAKSTRPGTLAGTGPRTGQTCSGVLVLDRDVAGAVRVDLDAGAHGRRDGDLLQVAALGAGRLQTEHLFERRGVVLRELDLGERGLADDEVQVRVPVDPELDLAALDVVDGLGDVRGDGAGLRVRHQTTRTEHAAETTDLAHH